MQADLHTCFIALVCVRERWQHDTMYRFFYSFNRTSTMDWIKICVRGRSTTREFEKSVRAKDAFFVPFWSWKVTIHFRGLYLGNDISCDLDLLFYFYACLNVSPTFSFPVWHPHKKKKRKEKIGDKKVPLGCTVLNASIVLYLKIQWYKKKR